MPIVKRGDGAQFVTYSYRELIDSQKTSILKNEIRQLAGNHGDYVRIYKRPNKKYEVVFGRESGILLGESVWEYFGKPQNLIYSEEIGTDGEALLVVVRSGFVYLDINVPIESVADELAGVISDNVKYDIYVHGNVFVNTDKRRKSAIPQEYINEFKRLENSAFDALPLDQRLHLQPLELALRDIGTSTDKIFILSSLIVILLIASIWWYFSEKPAKPKPVVVKPQPVAPAPVIPAYVSALSTPDPALILQEMASVATKVFFIPGWTATSIVYNAGNYTIQLKRENGTFEFLQNWANQQNMQMQLTSSSATLSYRSVLDRRKPPNALPALQPLLLGLMDRLQYLLPNSNVSISDISSVVGSRKTELTIPLNEMSTDTLNLLGKELSGYPIELKSANISISENIFGGTIVLTVLGK